MKKGVVAGEQPTIKDIDCPPLHCFKTAACCFAATASSPPESHHTCPQKKPGEDKRKNFGTNEIEVHTSSSSAASVHFTSGPQHLRMCSAYSSFCRSENSSGFGSCSCRRQALQLQTPQHRGQHSMASSIVNPGYQFSRHLTHGAVTVLKACSSIWHTGRQKC